MIELEGKTGCDLDHGVQLEASADVAPDATAQQQRRGLHRPAADEDVIGADRQGLVAVAVAADTTRTDDAAAVAQQAHDATVGNHLRAGSDRTRNERAGHRLLRGPAALVAKDARELH